jgi:hypothetical protein
MRRAITIMAALAASLVLAPAALATTQTAHSGDVSATFTYKGHYPNFSHEKLSISQSGTVFYGASVSSKFCGTSCQPASVIASRPSLQVIDLDDVGQPNVILGLFSGGAHCCEIAQVFTFDPGTMTYQKTERDFGDSGYQIKDLAHNSHFEFVGADDYFAYEFTDFAASGLPLQILSFNGTQFVNVTRSYPKLITQDANLWLKAYKSESKSHWNDTTGLIAAWAADEDELGHSSKVAKYLSQQAKAGHLNSPLQPQVSGGKKFITKLNKFLRAHGYLH